MCLLIVPFAYFWYEFYLPSSIWDPWLIRTHLRYEEWDVDTSAGTRIKGALKYSFCFIAFVVIIMAVGLFIPVADGANGHWDLDYFKKLLLANSMYNLS